MLSATYYRHRAELLRFALLTTSEPVAEARLRTIVEKYRGLADRADKHIQSSQGAQEPARSPPFPGMRASEMQYVATGRIRRLFRHSRLRRIHAAVVAKFKLDTKV